MMITIKEILEFVINNTNSNKLKEFCTSNIKEYININKQFTINNFNNLSFIDQHSANELFLNKILESLKDLKLESSEMDKDGLIRCLNSYKNANYIGVIKSLNYLISNNLLNENIKSLNAKYKLSSFLNGISSTLNISECVILNDYLNILKEYSHIDFFKKELSILNESLNNKDVEFFRHLFEIKASTGDFIFKSIKESFINYLFKNDNESYNKLLETLNRFLIYQPVKNFYSSILNLNESKVDFSKFKSNNYSVKVKSVYTPMIKEGKEVIFSIRNSFFKTDGKKLEPISEYYILNKYPKEYNLSVILNDPGVVIEDKQITIYNNDRKITLIKENDEVDTYLNGVKYDVDSLINKISFSTFNIFDRTASIYTINAIKSLYESFDEITNLEFAKTIYSDIHKDKIVDVIKLNEKMYIIKEDLNIKTKQFIADLNEIQVRNAINEYINYDIGDVFSDIITEKEKQLKILEKQKIKYDKLIEELENKLEKLNSIKRQFEERGDDESLNDLKEVTYAIENEIQELKKESNSIVSQMFKISELPYSQDLNKFKDIKIKKVEDEIENLKIKENENKKIVREGKINVNDTVEFDITDNKKGVGKIIYINDKTGIAHVLDDGGDVSIIELSKLRKINEGLVTFETKLNNKKYKLSLEVEDDENIKTDLKTEDSKEDRKEDRNIEKDILDTNIKKEDKIEKDILDSNKKNEKDEKEDDKKDNKEDNKDAKESGEKKDQKNESQTTSTDTTTIATADTTSTIAKEDKVSESFRLFKEFNSNHDKKNKKHLSEDHLDLGMSTETDINKFKFGDVIEFKIGDKDGLYGIVLDIDKENGTLYVKTDSNQHYNVDPNVHRVVKVKDVSSINNNFKNFKNFKNFNNINKGDKIKTIHGFEGVVKDILDEKLAKNDEIYLVLLENGKIVRCKKDVLVKI